MKGGGWPAREDNRTDPKGGDAVVAGLAAWPRMFGSLCLLYHAQGRGRRNNDRAGCHQPRHCA
jgi:hypothetical protein